MFGPNLLLLDEPFGALDRKLREALQLEVRRLQRRLGLTTLFITHDQEEALIMSDRIAVMDKGRIEQIGTPGDLYARPANRFVADFLGESNLLEAAVSGRSASVGGFGAIAVPQGTGNGPATLLIRPEAVRLGDDAAGLACLGTGEVTETVFLGLSAKLRLRVEGGTDILARIPLRPSTPPPARIGTRLAIGFSPEDVHVVPRV